jgi:SulP family sulfate permease
MKSILQFIPILQWLPNYEKAHLSGDLSAGLTVGIMLIPQGMAYAMLAGLPPVFGLYASLIPQIIYALLGTSRQLSVAPVAMDSLLVAAGLGALSLSGIEEYTSMAIFLALFMGSIQLLLGIVKMGFLVNFLSKPVISGFTSAAALIIGLSQLKHLLGAPIENSNQIHILLRNTVEVLDQINIYAIVLGVTAILIIKAIKRWIPKVPAALVVTILGIAITYAFNLSEYGLNIVKEVPSGLPKVGLPELSMNRFNDLAPIAVTLALIAFMEAISVAKAIEERKGLQEVRPNQELIAIGMANVVGSIFQSYPVTGGFSRTAVNDQAGASTPLASIISAIIVGLTLLFLTPLFYHLPKTVLAAIIMVAVFGLIDFAYPIRLFRKRKDEFVVLVITFLTTLTIGITEGIILGALISLGLMIYRTSQPHYAILGRIKDSTHYRNIKRFDKEVSIDPEVLFFRFDGQLYFGNKDYFKAELTQAVESHGSDLKGIVLSVEAINYIDSTAAHMLRQLFSQLEEKGIKVTISGPIGPIRDILKRSEIVDLIGKQSFFDNAHDAFLFIKGDENKIDEYSRRIALESKE